MESRTTKASKNIIYASIYQIIKLILAFVVRIIFVKKLGAMYLGVNGLFSNILNIFSLADMGITTAMMYSLYKPLAEKDELKISKYLAFFGKIYRIIAVTILTLGILFIPFLHFIINLPNNMPNIYLYYILLLINSVLSYLFVYKTTLLMADQKMYIINKYDIIFYFILFLLQILTIIFTKSFALYLISNILCTFVSNICKVKETNKIYPYIKKTNAKKYELNKKEKREIFTNVKSLFYYKLGGIIQSNTDNILISIFVGTIIVGYYSNYTMIILQCTSFITLIFSTLKSTVGNYLIEEDEKSKFKMFNILEVANYIIVGGASILFYILIPDFITMCFGKEYLLSKTLLLFLVMNFYTSNIRQTIWTFRESSGLFKKTKYITLITSALNLVFSIIFGALYGIVGIVFATVISRMLYAWWKEPQILFKDIFKEKVSSYYINYIKRIILTLILMLFLDKMFEVLIFKSVLVSLIIKFILSSIIIIIIFFIAFKKTDAYVFFKEKFYSIVKVMIHGKTIENR